MIECTYSNLNSVADYTARLHGVADCSQATTGTASFCIKQCEFKSSTRENDAANRCGEHRMHEAVAGVTAYTVLQQTFFI